MFKIERIRNIHFPTKEHERFIRYIIQKCSDLGIACFLKGSLARGNAQEFSDVDLVITGNNSPEAIDTLVTSFASILLSGITTTSTFLVVYDSGLAVEYDIRKTITMRDIENSVVLSRAKYQLSDINRDRVVIESMAFPKRNKEYSNLIIVQMCCAKLICRKYELARDIYCDRMKLLHGASCLPADFSEQVHSESSSQFIERLKNQMFLISSISASTKQYFMKMFEIIESKCGG